MIFKIERAIIMQLIYIWVEEFQNIRQTGFSFSDKYKVEVNSSLEKYEVVIEENKQIVETLLLGDNISISAIVGNNGIGKSTLLDLIRIMLFDQERIRDKNVGFSIWSQENKFVKRDFCNKQVIVNRIAVEEAIDKKEFSVIYYSDTLDMRHYKDDFDDGENIDHYIDEEDVYRTFNEPGEEKYWSSMLNLNLRNRYMEQYNVSTTFLLKYSKNNKDKIIDFFHGEVKRHIALYSGIRRKDNYENGIMFLKIPKNLTISVEFLSPEICDEVLDDHLVNYSKRVRDAKHGGNYKEHITIYLLLELLNIYESVVTREITNISELNYFISSFNDIICWNLLIIHIYWLLDERKDYEGNNKDDYSDVDEKLKNIIEGYNNSKDVFNFCRELFETFEAAEYGKSESILSFYESLKNFKKNNGQGINVEFGFPYNAIRAVRTEGRPFANTEKYISGWNGERNLSDLMNLYLKYEKVAGHVDFFTLDWGMSTGEFSLFSLFARIYSAVNRAFRGNRTEIMILLDEIDSTFHPSWQQIIINELANFLKLLYPEVKFQIILSTHSPVLLSDIPLQKVIFLTDQVIKEHNQTFAANIASLYYDSFLMKKGSIGSLAHRCIKNLADAMNTVIEEEIDDIKKRRKVLVDKFYKLHHLPEEDFNAEQYEEKVHQIRNLINSVGERIWRYKLNELFERCEVVTKENNINREFFEYIEQLKNKNGEEAVMKLLKELMEKNK